MKTPTGKKLVNLIKAKQNHIKNMEYMKSYSTS